MDVGVAPNIIARNWALASGGYCWRASPASMGASLQASRKMGRQGSWASRVAENLVNRMVARAI